jgi:hypothetical protein
VRLGRLDGHGRLAATRGRAQGTHSKPGSRLTLIRRIEAATGNVVDLVKGSERMMLRIDHPTVQPSFLESSVTVNL